MSELKIKINNLVKILEKFNKRFTINEVGDYQHFIRVTSFYLVLTLLLTVPVVLNFFSSVPSWGSDTMQVIGVSGEKANFFEDVGLLRGVFNEIKNSSFNILSIYAIFQIIFGRIVAYNILFIFSFVASGVSTYYLVRYLTKSKPAALVAGIIFAFSPFHFHNSMSTNVGTMHQEWLPLFALFLFKFFEELKPKDFFWMAFFLFLIGFTEHQLLAFTLIFILLFILYKLFSEPKKFLRLRLWVFAIISLSAFSFIFFLLFKPYLSVAHSADNYLNAGYKATVKYSNDLWAVLVPPSFHSFWPQAMSEIKEKFIRKPSSLHSVYVGYSVLLLLITSFFVKLLVKYRLKRNNEKEKTIPLKGLVFWIMVAISFWLLSLGPQLSAQGPIDPPIKMPYWLIYKYLPYYENIRTVGRFFVYAMLGLAVCAGWSLAVTADSFSKRENKPNELNSSNAKENFFWLIRKNIFYIVVALIIILEFLPVPLKTNSLNHSSIYERMGQDKEKYSIIEVPGSTDYNFASRVLVWKSIHRKNTVNDYDFARVIDDHFAFQKSTPIINELLYGLPNDSKSDKDIFKDSFYSISNDILSYYNVRYIILDKEGLKGKPEKGKPNLIFSGKAYIKNVVKCSAEFEDDFAYACQVEQKKPEGIFLALDMTNDNWIGKSRDEKNGLRRWAQSGAVIRVVNMSQEVKDKTLSFSVKVYRPLSLSLLFNGKEVLSKYLTQIDKKINISSEISGILPGENKLEFVITSADGKPVKTEKKSESVIIYNVALE